MEAVRGLCTAEAKEKAVRLMLVAKGNSATPAYFSAVPLAVGEFPITITALDTVSRHSDSISKNLNVVVSITSWGQALHEYVFLLEYNLHYVWSSHRANEILET